MKNKIMLIFGTRPDAVKMAPLVKTLKERSGDWDVSCCVTGQHREMLDSVLDSFGVVPDFDLDIMSHSQSLESIVSKTLLGCDKVFAEQKPDLVLVHGDTATGFAGALSAFYHKIPVGHVEAGLRTYDRYSPFPEEMNRRMLASLAAFHFCPTERNRLNLHSEGITENVYVTGNTVIDALSMTVSDDYQFDNKVLSSLPFGERRVLLATVHRRENYGKPLEDIFGAFRDIVSRFPDTALVLPVHLSPVVREAVKRNLTDVPGIILTEPLSVTDMHNLMARCHLVLTDSGGLQEEAPALGKPVLVLRRETERPEAVEAGTVELVGISRGDIFTKTARLLTDERAYEKQAKAVNPYGDGRACRRIMGVLANHFEIDNEPVEEFKP